MNQIDVQEAITQAHRDEWARVVAVLTRRFGDLDVAEEATAEAFAIALVRWPDEGMPPSPGAWLTTTASRKAIDRMRRESKRNNRQKEARRGGHCRTLLLHLSLRTTFGNLSTVLFSRSPMPLTSKGLGFS